jgi:mono/diheme cytochrome c family protein
MNTKSIAPGARTAVAAIALALLPVAAHAAMPGERTGEEVVKNYCALCHATGLRGAPKVGDAKAWEPRAAKAHRAGQRHPLGHPRARRDARARRHGRLDRRGNAIRHRLHVPAQRGPREGGPVRILAA